MQKFLSERELAVRWSSSVKTLQSWRLKGKGPKFTKLGRSVRYPVPEVERFEAENMASSTSSS